ncbi:DUF4231 domain-containing protein [Thiobacillus sp.]|uniref:DUF4231 domain-containing protein n=1 Tax=Thiobacillus sp. TaxID=924 RepID=UPI001819DCD8|nr:DUF4231 domain-containing protein [Thiobacillus sp.]MBC2732463.1 DUF4231 domain-containing protein [Thiobacillus sp.]MBC2741201.1 DUF4231 domain-containing protein [Thiobacillus sp.]MBC2761437.1 DUF4231 domain-containing protein [Thiobacillus sp.]
MASTDKNTTTEPGINVPDFAAAQPAWLRLEDQMQWYDNKSLHSQRWYKWLKLAQVALAVLIPVMSLLPADLAKWATAISGIAIALLEAVQQMNQYSTLWVTYRATAERLKHEKYLFLSAAGPYRGLPEPERLIQLAERVEEHVSTEHANWFNETRRVAATAKPEGK